MARKPTQSEVTRFISCLLPPKANDVSFLYHVPKSHGKDNSELLAPVDRVILSVTPTAQVYNAIGHERNPASGDKTPQSHEATRTPYTIAFIHRPFKLDRSRIRDHSLVLSSHTSFDEHLTIGYNPTLAQRLDINLPKSICVQGYKGDAERKIGIIGQVSNCLGHFLTRIEHEFGAFEHAQEGLSEEIKVLIMMNSFSADEVHRVLDLAHQQNWVPDCGPLGRHVLYVTGQPRKSGLEVAKERGMTVVCLGHRVAEQWGISYMAASLRGAFPALKVEEIYEDELPNRTEKS